MSTALSTGRGVIAARGLVLRLALATGLLAVVLPAAGPALTQTITFDPSYTLPDDYAFSVALRIDCAGEPVHGVEVAVAFDPFLVRLDAVTPGAWYAGAGAPFYFFDYTPELPQGTIRFASAVLGGIRTGSDILAVCHFSALGFGVTPLVFQDVDVRDAANAPLPFGHSTGDLILLDPAIAAERTSFGSVKALFR